MVGGGEVGNGGGIPSSSSISSMSSIEEERKSRLKNYRKVHFIIKESALEASLL